MPDSTSSLGALAATFSLKVNSNFPVEPDFKLRATIVGEYVARLFTSGRFGELEGGDQVVLVFFSTLIRLDRFTSLGNPWVIAGRDDVHGATGWGLATIWRSFQRLQDKSLVRILRQDFEARGRNVWELLPAVPSPNAEPSRCIMNESGRITSARQSISDNDLLARAGETEAHHDETMARAGEISALHGRAPASDTLLYFSPPPHSGGGDNLARAGDAPCNPAIVAALKNSFCPDHELDNTLGFPLITKAAQASTQEAVRFIEGAAAKTREKIRRKTLTGDPWAYTCSMLRRGYALPVQKPQLEAVEPDREKRVLAAIQAVNAEKERERADRELNARLLASFASMDDDDFAALRDAALARAGDYARPHLEATFAEARTDERWAGFLLLVAREQQGGGR